MGIKSSNTSESYYNRFMNSGKGAASPAPIPFTATGGTTHTPGNGYKYHTFTTSGSFVVSSGQQAVEVLCVGAGGGGGSGPNAGNADCGGSGGGGGGGGAATTDSGYATNQPTANPGFSHTLNIYGTSGGDGPTSPEFTGGGGGGAGASPHMPSPNNNPYMVGGDGGPGIVVFRYPV